MAVGPLPASWLQANAHPRPATTAPTGPPTTAPATAPPAAPATVPSVLSMLCQVEHPASATRMINSVPLFAMLFAFIKPPSLCAASGGTPSIEDDNAQPFLGGLLHHTDSTLRNSRTCTRNCV